MHILSHFALPARRRMIDGMSVEAIEEVFDSALSDPKRDEDEPVYVVCARVAHRLANTYAPEVDPDKRAKETYAAYCSAAEFQPVPWHLMEDKQRNGWRAVAGMEGKDD